MRRLALWFVFLVLLAAPLHAEEQEEEKETAPPADRVCLVILDHDAISDGRVSWNAVIMEWAGRELVRNRAWKGYSGFRFLSGKKATGENLIASIQSLADGGKTIDLFILAHGLRERIGFRDGLLHSREIRRQLGNGKGGQALRMVYQCTCWGATLVDDWLAVGAEAAVGHTGLNTIPFPHIPFFLTAWVGGKTFAEAARSATRRAYALFDGVVANLLVPLLPGWMQKTWRDGIRGSRIRIAGAENLRIDTPAEKPADEVEETNE